MGRVGGRFGRAAGQGVGAAVEGQILAVGALGLGREEPAEVVAHERAAQAHGQAVGGAEQVLGVAGRVVAGSSRGDDHVIDRPPVDLRRLQARIDLRLDDG